MQFNNEQKLINN